MRGNKTETVRQGRVDGCLVGWLALALVREWAVEELQKVLFCAERLGWVGLAAGGLGGFA